MPNLQLRADKNKRYGVVHEDSGDGIHPLCNASAPAPDGSSNWDNGFDHSTDQPANCGNCARMVAAGK
jgi:hypothetical protein